MARTVYRSGRGSGMRAALRWVVVAVVLTHGFLHLRGAAQGLGWAEVARLQEPISAGLGVGWLAAALLVVAAGAGLAMAASWWWPVAGLAAVASQAMILTASGEAAAGTAANVVLVLAAVYGYASRGPRSLRAEYRREAEATLAEPDSDGVVREADLEHLPAAVAAYVRRSGAVGRPRVTSFRARMHGRIRAGADRPWMTFVGEQVNSYGARTARLFFMDATMFGLPVDVLHTYVGADASMRVKVCSLVSMVDVSGPQMTQAETVTVFNDLCVFAPAALVDAPVTWQPLDERRVRGTYTTGVNTVTAELVFNDDDELVDFVSDDRLAASPGGQTFTPRRWSTPLHAYGELDGRHVAVRGEGRWHPEDAPAFAYIELELDDLAYNVGATPSPGESTTGTGRALPTPTSQPAS